MSGITIRLEIRNKTLQRQLEGVIRGNRDFEVLISAAKTKADLVVYELAAAGGESLEEDFHRIQSLLESGDAGEVFLIADTTDHSLLIRAMRLGAREFFHKPLDEGEFRRALDGLRDRIGVTGLDRTAPAGKILTLIGSKGGTGTTTVGVNLSVSLAADRRVVLLDLNQVFGEIPHFLDMSPNYSWGEITKNINRLDATFLQNVLDRHETGVYVLPSPSYLSDEPAATPAIMERLLKVMVGAYDFVVIDGGNSLEALVLKCIEMSDLVFLVSILSVPCLANTSKILNSLGALGFPTGERVKVIINRYLDKTSISIEDAVKAIDHEIFWKVPNDYQNSVSAINRGVTLSQLAPGAPITRSIEALGDTLLGREGAKGKQKKWWKRSK